LQKNQAHRSWSQAALGMLPANTTQGAMSVCPLLELAGEKYQRFEASPLAA
jgi:hypothetical protein